MKNNYLIFLTYILTTMVFSCKKKAADVAPVDIPERLVMSPATQNVIAGQTSTFTLEFYDKKGVVATLPTSIEWSSNNVNIATVQNGVATGVSAGQATIKATYQSPGVTTPVEATALLTVLAAGTNQDNVVASITIQQTTQELSLNGTATLQAVAKNSVGTVLTRTFVWTSANSNLVSVNNTGLVTGVAYGTTNITASTDGIQSSPAMVQVIRSGTMSGQVSAGGMVKLKIENGVLKLQTTSNFSVATSAPDLRIYLSNNATNVTGGLQIATLNQRTGAQTWNLPAGVTISQYRYVVVWCLQFSAFYGGADLGL